MTGDLWATPHSRNAPTEKKRKKKVESTSQGEPSYLPTGRKLVRQARACGTAAGIGDKIAQATDYLKDAEARVVKLQSGDYQEFVTGEEHRQLITIRDAVKSAIAVVAGIQGKAFAIKEAMISRK